MTILEGILLGIVGAIVALKVLLLAAATVIFMHGLTQRIQKHAITHRSIVVKHSRLNGHA